MDVPDIPESSPRSGENSPLLAASPAPSIVDSDARDPSTSTARRLYLSHFLSTWNSRVFEFGAVIYLTSIFPGTLLPMSIYAFVRGLWAIAFASAIGAFIDRENRLKVVRISIISQRLSVAMSCAIFYWLAKSPSTDRTVLVLAMVVLALLACIEKVGSIANTVSVEKDWVVVVAGDDSSTLATLNSQMRRIDLHQPLHERHIGPGRILGHRPSIFSGRPAESTKVGYRLSNHEIAAGLHYRLLTPAYSPVCAACANESDLGHDEVCRLRETWSIRRHDSINRVIHSYLSRVAGAVVTLEPSTQTGRRRNDLRVRGGGGGLRNVDYDLKVYGLEDKSVYVVQGGKPREMEWIDWVRGRMVAWLSKRDAEVVDKAPRIYGGAFRPLVLSAGGFMSEETAVEWRSWRKCLEKEVWHGLHSRVAIELVKARGRTLWM
ncbi:hypothetical protein I350_06524 [Cryptococcus amylolentus CBS 6273]|uniref:Solute carrier family 40 member n=1 Tax=Cryptococcus amylolentus CBS 6273 TaxID=1296118 RepID=A0A1E3JLG8_9TREE|nr:hypothetical protein I350_06524 [Cryptococcus amylolentus CBS 6273]